MPDSQTSTAEQSDNPTGEASEDRSDLTSGPVRNRLFDLWLPMIGGVLAVKLIGVSDAYFIGQLGEDELAAVSFTFPIVMTLITLAIGLSSGASSVLSRAIGEADDSERRGRIVAGAMGLTALLAVCVSIIGALLIGPVLGLLGAEGRARELATSYMYIWFAGALVMMIPIVINGLLRATGDGRTPALLMSGVAALNIAINPLLIYGVGPVPVLGVQGAATATVLARGVSMFVSLWLLYRRDLLVFRLSALQAGVGRWGEIIRIGVPAAISTSLNPVAVAVATAAVATLGTSAVAGFGVAQKVQSIALVPLLALSSASAPFAGQNSGADKPGRTRAMLRWCGALALGWSIAAAVFFFAAGDWLAAQFTGSEAAAGQAALYLLIVPVSYAGYGVVIALSAALNGLGRSLQALMLAGGRAIGLLAPAAWIGVWLGGFSGFAWSTFTANIAAGLVVLAVFRAHSLTVTQRRGTRYDTAECE